MAHFDDVRGWFGWDEPEVRLHEVKVRLVQLSAANAVVSLALGLIPTGVTRHNFVGFFATAALAFLMIELIGAVRFLQSAARVTHKPFIGIHRMLSWAPLGHAILMTGALLAGTVSCVQQFTGMLDLLVLAGFLVSTVLSFVMYRMYRSIRTFSLPEQD